MPVNSARRTIAVALVAAVLLLPTLAYGAGYDHGFLQYIGRTVVQGKWPYVASFDTTFPGAILFHAAVIALGGESILALRIADLLLQVATAVLLYRCTCRIAGTRAGFLAAALYAIAYTQAGYYDTAQRDGYIAVFLLLSLIWLWRYLDDPARRAALMLSGLAAGVACLIRPTYALLVALAVLGLAPRPRRALTFGLMSALPMAIFFAVYYFANHWSALSDVLQYDMTVYPAIERGTVLYVLKRFVTTVPLMIWLGAALSRGARTVRTAHRREIAMVIVVIIGCVLVRLWEMKAWRYQYWPAVAFLTILAGVGWNWLIERVAPRRAALAVALLLAVQLGWHGFARYRTMWGELSPRGAAAYTHLVADSPDEAALLQYLTTHAEPHDTIQMWGPETIVLFATDHPSATRFIDPLVFVCPDPHNPHHSILFTDCGSGWHKPVQAAFLHELLNALTTRPPQYIAAHYANGSLAIDTTFSLAPDLPELRALLDQRYTRAATFGPWSVFRRVMVAARPTPPR